MSGRVRLGRTRGALQRRATPLHALVAAVGAVGGGALALALAAARSQGLGLDHHFAVVLAATLFSDATWVNLRIRHQVESYTWAELNLALALAWLAPYQVVLTALAIGLAYAVSRRSPLKVLFNTTSYAFGVGLAAVTTRAIAHPTWAAPGRSATAIAAGVLVFTIWNGASVNAAIAFSQDLPFRQVFARGAGLRFAVAAGNLVLGLLVLGLSRWRPDALWAVPAGLVAAYAGYRSYLRVIQDRAAWRQLETAGHEIHRLDEREVAQAALARAASLFDADEVELTLYDPQGVGPAHVYLTNAAGSATMLQAEPERASDDFTVTTYPGDGRHARETAVTVPVAHRGKRVGVLCVRFFGAVQLSARERHLLNTFASTVAAGVENARLYAHMQAEAARHETASRHDALTGLANRVLFEERTRNALQHRRRASGVAVLLIDLDRFKEVNDRLGHAAGDVVLREVASRLRRGVRPQDTVSRLGGDEFAVLLDDAGAAEATARRLCDLVGEPIDCGPGLVAVGASIGFACYPHDAIAYEDLMRRADAAMYQAKQSGADFHRYNPASDRALLDGLNVVDELQGALERGEIEVHFQPEIDLRSGAAVGAEALVRWRHPSRGLLPPSLFLPAVETSGLLRPLTCRVLDAALSECAAWRRAGRDLKVAVNLSAHNFAGGALAHDVAEALARHSLPPQSLVLEITEAAILADLELAEDQVATLVELGVAISIDDFGTGHLGLRALRRMHAAEVKLDRSFVAGMLSSDEAAAVAEATVHLAHSLGMRTVAEGVEEPRIVQRLIDVGCDCAQGFHWSTAVSAEEVRVLLGLEADAQFAT